MIIIILILAIMLHVYYNGCHEQFDPRYEKKVCGKDRSIKRTIKKMRDQEIKKNECEVDRNAEIVQKFIRDKVLNGNLACECVPNVERSDFTRDEVDGYREQQIEFRDKLYGSSSPAVDAVDRMNEITYQGGIPATGQRIGQLYDELVGMKSIGITGQEIPGKYKQLIKDCTSKGIKNYLTNAYEAGNAGTSPKIYTQDMWKYRNEQPQNGGVHYDDIKDRDPMFEQHADYNWQ